MSQHLWGLDGEDAIREATAEEKHRGLFSTREFDGFAVIEVDGREVCVG